MAPPALLRRARRFEGPNPLAQNPKLEPIHQSLYSGGSLAANTALPRELLLFQYAVGGTIPGSASAAMSNATLLQTNMRTAGFVAAPKVFLIEGIRVIPSQLTTPLTATAPAAHAASLLTAAAEQDYLTDVLKIIYSGVLDLSVGPKNYQEAPLWMFPANSGVDGVIAVGGTGTATNINQFPAYHTAGRYFGLNRYPILIPAQQQFQVALRWLSTINPTIAPTQTTFNAFLYVSLDGLLGREVS